MYNKNKKAQRSRGFTIVELIVVIVIIGILAAISIISYTGINDKAIAAGMQSDIRATSTQIEMYRVINGNYPQFYTDVSDIKVSPDNSYQYTLSGGNYCLSITSTRSTTFSYHVSSTTGGVVQDGVCAGHVAPGGTQLFTAPGNQIAAGINNSCSIGTDNYAYCWGQNTYGQVGNNSPYIAYTPSAIDRSGVLSGKTIKSVSVGLNHSCAIASDNQAYCWGYNNYGQLGNNSTTQSNVPVAVNTTGALNGKTIKSISAGWSATCAIASDDQAYCWGYDTYGGLGNNSTTRSLVPVAVDTTGVLSGKTIKSISAGQYFACVTASDDQAYCWGYDNYGQLGNNSVVQSLVPVAVDTTGLLSGKTVKSISTGYNHTCAIASDDRAYCWGYNPYGGLGNNTSTNSSVPVAVDTTGVLSGKNIKTIAAGYYATCAFTSDDQVSCWGYNGYGQLGNNSTAQSRVPVAIDTSGAISGKTIKSISFNWTHVCAAYDDNHVYCWGGDDFGQLGIGSTSISKVAAAVDSSYTPPAILSGLTNTAVSSGYYNACSLTSGGQVYCWGYNTLGQVGNNTTDNSYVPSAVYTAGALSGKTIKSISTGWANNCAIASDDQVYCWGDGFYGALGNNTTVLSKVPVATDTTGVLSGKTIKSVSTGYYATCVIASDDLAYCWGYNTNGGLGNNSTTQSKVPVAVDTTGVLSGKTIKSISVGQYYTCAIASDDLAYCWGNNSNGQLGNNSTTQSLVPVAVNTAGVLSGKTMKSISTGYNHTCAIASDDQVYCWGYDLYGQLGNNSTTQSTVPVAVTTTGAFSGKTVKSIFNSYYSTCAVASDNQVYCWGNNTYGQLGNNSTTQSKVPVAVDTTGVLSGKTIKSMSTSNYSVCVIASDDQIYCWGNNLNGELGNNSTVNSLVPVSVYLGQ